MNKILIGIVVVVIIIAGGYLLLKSPETSAPNSSITPQSTLQEIVSTVPTLTTLPSTTQTTQPTEQSIINYTNGGYSPNTFNIKIGTTITFKNNSSRSMWPASAVHPTHRLYPTTGGCIGSTFDACKGIQPGGSWSFKFDIAGTWKYHDHLNPSAIGTITAE